MRRLYLGGRAMRSEDKEYRRRDHRPIHQHQYPVEEHRDLMAQICACNKHDQLPHASPVKNSSGLI
jgi:hypothetical protein